MRKLVICGAGGHGAEVIDIARNINAVEPRWHLAGFVDRHIPAGTIVRGLPVLGDDRYLLDCGEPVDVVLGIGDAAARERIAEELSKNPRISFPAAVHPSACLSPDASVGEGAVVSPLAVAAAGSRLGRFSLINHAAFVGRGVRVGAFSLIMSGAVLSDGSVVGDRCLVGARAAVDRGLSLGDGAVVGVGSIVFEDVPPGVTVFGNPARHIWARSCREAERHEERA